MDNVKNMSRNERKRDFGHVRLAKIRISLCIRAIWSESSLGAFWVAKDASSLHVDKKDWSDSVDAQAGLRHRLTYMYKSEGTFSHVLVHITVKMFQTDIDFSYPEGTFLQRRCNVMTL